MAKERLRIYKKRITFFELFLVICLAILALTFIYPIWVVIVNAFTTPSDFVKNPLALFPKNISLYNFKRLMSANAIWVGYYNTLIYTVVGTIISVSGTFVMAYGFSMKELPYKKFFNLVVVIPMFFAGGMIPSYLAIKSYNMIDTIWAMVIPGAISTYNLMLTRTYVTEQIPLELKESAEIDGAGPITVFLRIVTPLSKPILTVLAMFSAAGHWNAYYNALLYLRDDNKYPLQLVLRALLMQEQTDMLDLSQDTITEFYSLTLNYSIILISILPVLIVFPFVAKNFEKGVMIGAIKG